MGFKDRLEKVFSYLQIGSSSFSALNVGALDIAVATGVLFATIGTSSDTLKILGAMGLVFRDNSCRKPGYRNYWKKNY